MLRINRHFLKHQALRAILITISSLSALNADIAISQPQYYNASGDDSQGDAIIAAMHDAVLKKSVARVDAFVAQLSPDHPLYSFAEYWQLKVRLPDINDADAQRLIDKYSGQFVADRLRNDWLLALGKRGDWRQFDAQRPLFILADDAQVDCYSVASQSAQGTARRDTARTTLFKNANNLAGEGCMAAVKQLYQTQVFKADDVRDAIHVLSEGKHASSIGQLNALIGSARSASNPPSMAHAAVHSASACAQRLQNNCNTVFRSNNASNGKFIDLPATLEGLGSDNALEWALRGALRAQDWALIAVLVPRLPQHLQNDPTWVYWYARAVSATQSPEAARPFYEKIASATNANSSSNNAWGFYNLLAKEALGLPLVLPAVPVLDETVINSVFKRADLARMEAFYRVGLRWEGNREWNWLVRGLSDEQLPNYAEAARRINRLDRMISTADRVKGASASDFTQRFPMPYIEQAQPIANSTGLDSNWVYGLMRQESRFISDVRSSVSARGLMQIMPATASFVAKKIGLTNYTTSQLSDIDVNLNLGHHYLAMVMSELDQSPVLATAAYNAGPSRSKTWRASLDHTVEGAVFAESIPFNETRSYVKNVLANAVIYGLVTGNKPRTLQSWLGTITPKGVTETALP
jgi:soluble lytic murein transglycosylase